MAAVPRRTLPDRTLRRWTSKTRSELGGISFLRIDGIRRHRDTNLVWSCLARELRSNNHESLILVDRQRHHDHPTAEANVEPLKRHDVYTATQTLQSCRKNPRVEWSFHNWIPVLDPHHNNQPRDPRFVSTFYWLIPRISQASFIMSNICIWVCPKPWCIPIVS